MILFHNDKSSSFKLLNRRKIKHWIADIAVSYQKKIGDINYIFCSDKKILEINKEYLQHDYYTDIISFDNSENDTLSGDLFISIDTVKTNANKYDSSFEDELHRVMVHGLLHLIGYNDKTSAQQQKMRQAENQALVIFNKQAIVPRGTKTRK